ncbi:hypothetical protein F53441_6364 [Fusarium austroafricanum]|uniref:Xylanolytic transcriptional activator regulatory domain-containing protein n=1 Tax=Fusarium austroafricanum TaxID=2364996 RepID=A0A8H4NTF2_9HYPO|nr:hypothetical protein F53441_6364 [Fusarium austroafricanum]
MAISKPSVYVLDPYHPDAIAALRKSSDVNVILPTDPNKVEYIEKADAVMLRSETRLGADKFAKCKKLKYIVKQGAGVDNVDLEAAAAAGIQVYNTPGLNAESVAELTLALALTLSRRVAEIDRRTRNGEAIVRSQTLGKSLYKRTLGVVGMGHIGLSIAKKWVGAMEGNIIAYDPFSDGKKWLSIFGESRFSKASTLDELLKASDVVTLHLPRTESTENCISSAEFDVMKDEAILLNCARGGIVDEIALFAALKSGKLFGAGLDAMLVEPPTVEAYPELLALPNVIMTPHVGASTVENQSQSGLAVVDITLAYNETCEYDRPPPMTQIRAMADKIAQLEQTIQNLQNNGNAPNGTTASPGDNITVAQSTPAENLPAFEVASGSLDNTLPYYDTTSAVHGPGDTPSQASTGRISAVMSPEDRHIPQVETLNGPELKFWEDQAVESAAVYLHLPQHVIRRLFATHWTWVHANFMFVPRAVFLRDAAVGGKFFTPFLLCVLCLHSTRFRDRHLTEQLLARAKLLFSHEIHNQGSIPMVQALLQFSAREIGRGSVSQAWLYGGMAFRVAIDIGLFSYPPSGPGKSEDIRETQLGRHLAWSCFLWDKTLSLYLGRSPSLPEPPKWDPAVPEEPEPDIWPPYPFAEDESLNSYAPRPSHLILCFAYTCKISVIINDILLNIYGNNSFGFQRFTYVMAYCTYTAATVVVQDLKDGRPGTVERFKTFTRALNAIRASCPGIQRSIDILTAVLESNGGTTSVNQGTEEPEGEADPDVPLPALCQFPQIPVFPYLDFGTMSTDRPDDANPDTTASTNPFFDLDSFPQLWFDDFPENVQL